VVNFINVFARDFRKKFWRQKFQTQNTAFVRIFSTKNPLSYKKRARKTLMKLTPAESIGDFD